MLARAERMHRQFFPPSGSSAPVAWEPPVDVLETERAVLVLVALPGVDYSEVKALISQGELLISGRRTYPEEMRTAIIHRLELPQGRFERRIRLPWAATAPFIDRNSRVACWLRWRSRRPRMADAAGRLRRDSGAAPSPPLPPIR